MKRTLFRLAAFALALAPIYAAAVEPLVGKWQLKSQQISGEDTALRPLTLDIRAQGEALQFEYSVPSGNSRTVSLRFVARLDGSASDIQDAQGRKIGTARLAHQGALEYSVTLEGPNRPTASGTMKLSADRKTLTCESDSAPPGAAKTHTVQIFTRE